MRHLRHLVAALAICSPVAALAGEEPGLPRAMTTEELDWSAKNPSAGFKALTAPPTGPLVSTTEYSPSQAILFGYSGTNGWKNIIAQMAKFITVDAQSEVWVIVTSTAQQNDMTSRFTTYGANLSKVRVFTAPLNSIWARDYGPRFIHEGGCRVIVDSTYYSSRPSDDAVPSFLAGALKMPYYATDLYHSGGNYHMGEPDTGYASTLVTSSNTNRTEAQIKDIFRSYYGLYTQLWTQFPSTVDGTGHIDIKGFKVRGNPIYNAFLTNYLGAQVINLNSTDLYTALERGTVDAQENPLTTIEAKKFYEVQKAIMLTGHIVDGLTTQIAPHLWNKLSDAEKKMFTEVTQEAANRSTAKIKKREAELVDEFKKKGLQIVQVDRKTFQDAVLKNAPLESMGYTKADFDKIQAAK